MTPIHPGEHLAEELKELGISAAEFSRRIAVPAIASRKSSTAPAPSQVTIRLAERKSGRAIKSLPTIENFQHAHM